jgi:hypothetical protein
MLIPEEEPEEGFLKALWAIILQFWLCHVVSSSGLGESISLACPSSFSESLGRGWKY